MRRLFTKKETGTEAHKAQKAIMHNVSIEQKRIEEFKSTGEQLEETIALKQNLIEKLSGEIVVIQETIKKCQAEQIKEKSVLAMLVKESKIKSELIKTIEQHRESTEKSYAIAIDNHNEQFAELQKGHAKNIKESEEVISILEKKKKSLENDIKLAQYAIDTADKQLADVIEKTNKQNNRLSSIESEILVRNSELSDIHKMIVGERTLLTKAIQETEIAEQALIRIQNEIKLNTETLINQEKEIENSRDTIVGLAAREKRINELIPVIKDLYEKAGIKIADI